MSDLANRQFVPMIAGCRVLAKCQLVCSAKPDLRPKRREIAKLAAAFDAR